MKIPEDSCQSGFTRTWMLFESGNVVSVDLSLFSAPKENIRPIDAYVVTEAEGTVTYSARRAAGAVYEVVSNYRPDIDPVVAGFDFNADFPVTGESGGLAFAVALAKRLLNKDPGPVAATGIIESSHNSGPIKKVRGIEAKLKAAGVVLPPGGWVFYPEENENEVPAVLYNRLISKGLKLHPVSSVAQTIEILFANTPLKKNNPAQGVYPKKTALISFLLFLIILAASIGGVLWKDSRIPAEQILVGKSDSISDTPQIEIHQPAIENNTYENEEDKKGDEQGAVIDLEEKTADHNDAEIEERTPESYDIEHLNSSVTVNIFGNTRLNAEISKVLTTKLEKFFALPHHHLGPVENVFISGQVVVLRMEENWVEERQQFRSNIRVALRDFVYEDKNRKIESTDIEVTVYARGMVEDMLPLAAQELMNKMINSLLSDAIDNYGESPPEPHEKPSGRPERIDSSGSDSL
jgi:hypothetical protein